MLIIRLLVTIFAISALAGCVGPQLQPKTETLSKLLNIYIVPMETPPLTIGSSYAATGSASIVHFLPRYTIGMARAVGVLSGIVVLLDLSASSHREMEYPPLIQPIEAWNPSIEFSKAAAMWLI